MSKNNFCYKVNIRNIHQKLTEKKCFFCGDCRIRTYGPFRTNGLVDRRFRPLSQVTLKNSCGGRIRTSDHKVMSLVSYLCSTPQYKKEMYIDTTQAFRPIIS